MEENTREGRVRSMRKYVVGCVHAVVVKKKFLVQFKDGIKRDISSSLLSYLCSKKEVCLYTYEPISNLPEKEQGELLNIDEDPDHDPIC